ncbi:ATP-dependent RNA helicase DDX42 [Manis javanica]|nr:ATP-dependent RNA helicase DDX42 [Manis javanica]
MGMALEGLRDLSVIATAPQRRLAIKTFVRNEGTGVIREAVLRELKRGSQCYFLHNEVETIENRKQKLEEILPEARIAVAHGQMPERELERVMRDFVARRYNILLCSTIIETGIDVPSSNTILISRADKFGLAQLHQLRGRVGRSHHQAYAYLMVPDLDSLTKQAQQRLEAIQQMEELGSGFYLAMHDLEIRGAGEVLGENQSGNMMERDQIDTLLEEIVDRFGKLPPQAQTLIDVHRLRVLSQPYGVVKVDAAPGVINITFKPQPPVDPMAIIHLIQKNKHIKLAGNEKLRIERALDNPKDRAQMVRDVPCAAWASRWWRRRQPEPHRTRRSSHVPRSEHRPAGPGHRAVAAPLAHAGRPPGSGRPADRMASPLVTPLLGVLVLLPWIWALPTLHRMPLQLQWSSAPLVVLMLGWPLADAAAAHRGRAGRPAVAGPGLGRCAGHLARRPSPFCCPTHDRCHRIRAGLLIRGIQPPLKLADYKLIAFDMDSTLITIECIDEIADATGKKAEVSAITEATMRGEITDFKDSLRQRVGKLVGVTEADMARVLAERLKLSPGAETLVRAARLRA